MLGHGNSPSRPMTPLSATAATVMSSIVERINVACVPHRHNRCPSAREFLFPGRQIPAFEPRETLVSTGSGHHLHRFDRRFQEDLHTSVDESMPSRFTRSSRWAATPSGQLFESRRRCPRHGDHGRLFSPRVTTMKSPRVRTPRRRGTSSPARANAGPARGQGSRGSIARRSIRVADRSIPGPSRWSHDMIGNSTWNTAPRGSLSSTQTSPSYCSTSVRTR